MGRKDIGIQPLSWPRICTVCRKSAAYLSGTSSRVRNLVNWDTTRLLMLPSSLRSASRLLIRALTCIEKTHRKVRSYSESQITSPETASPVVTRGPTKTDASWIQQPYLGAGPPLVFAVGRERVLLVRWVLHQLPGLDLGSAQGALGVLLSNRGIIQRFNL